MREQQRVEEGGKECVEEEKREESHLNENHIQIRGEERAAKDSGLEGFA